MIPRFSHLLYGFAWRFRSRCASPALVQAVADPVLLRHFTIQSEDYKLLSGVVNVPVPASFFSQRYSASSSAMKLFARAGRIVCSLNPVENEAVVACVLKNNPSYHPHFFPLPFFSFLKKGSNQLINGTTTQIFTSSTPQ
ncbi:hypothetical protein B0H19DRAFT_1267815 [Mycena capillaripes]|nr:hypothetical protein B0H19DRAFT_1267815 [Mycena capillaripes]